VESDLNFVMRSLWGREMMKWSEQHSGINNNQFGGRKGVQAQTAALNKTITCDVIRYYAEDASLIDNDAQACYDRSVPVLLAYALLRLGLPIHLIKFQCKWLEEAIYFFKLSDRVSKEGYGHTEKHPLYGTGQGTGWSPPSWTALSYLISRVMDKFAPGIKLVHPDGSFIQRVLDAFVDDVNGGLTKEGFQDFIPRNDNILQRGKTVYEQTQYNMQLYSHLLCTTGGKLALHKCAIYMLITHWVQDRRRLQKTHLIYPPIKIQPGIQHASQEVKVEDVRKARRVLGVYVAPDGGSNQQYKILREKSVKWATNVKSQYLSGHETFMAYKQGVMKSLEFPTGASYLNETQCHRIQSPALIACLQNNGVVSTINRDLVFGPYRYGCLNLTNIHTNMNIQKLEMLIGHTRKMDKTRKILEVAIGCLQQEVGISTPVLEAVYGTYSCITTFSWVQQLWKFLQEIGGSIHMPSLWTPVSPFENDVNISNR